MPYSPERYTGDIGYLDEDGYHFIVDRKKDVIKPSGFQVWPREVAEVIAAHPAVAEVGVAGVPDAYSGEAVKAWVVLRAGQDVDADELQAFCRARLAAYKVPRQIEFRAGLPKTLIGKVLRRELAVEGGASRKWSLCSWRTIYDQEMPLGRLSRARPRCTSSHAGSCVRSPFSAHSSSM